MRTNLRGSEARRRNLARPITEASTLNMAIGKVTDITRDMDPTDALQVASSVLHQIARAQDTPPGYHDKLLVIFRQLDRFADSW
jgi:hypothetical protein